MEKNKTTIDFVTIKGQKIFKRTPQKYGNSTRRRGRRIKISVHTEHLEMTNTGVRAKVIIKSFNS